MDDDPYADVDEPIMALTKASELIVRCCVRVRCILRIFVHHNTSRYTVITQEELRLGRFSHVTNLYILVTSS